MSRPSSSLNMLSLSLHEDVREYYVLPVAWRGVLYAMNPQAPQNITTYSFRERGFKKDDQARGAGMMMSAASGVLRLCASACTTLSVDCGVAGLGSSSRLVPAKQSIDWRMRGLRFVSREGSELSRRRSQPHLVSAHVLQAQQVPLPHSSTAVDSRESENAGVWATTGKNKLNASLAQRG